MLGRSSPFRLLITLLLVVSMPLCCCTFRSLGKCCPSQDAAPTTSAARVASEHANHDHSHCHAVRGEADHHDVAKPCSPSDDGDTCGCGKSLTKLGIVGKPVVEIPAPAMVAILPIADYVPVAAMPSQSARAEAAKPALPPATSLLRLHCALTV